MGLSEDMKKRIETLVRAGKKASEIAELLKKEFQKDIPVTTIYYYIGKSRKKTEGKSRRKNRSEDLGAIFSEIRDLIKELYDKYFELEKIYYKNLRSLRLDLLKKVAELRKANSEIIKVDS